jgi:hypothetical protein
MAEDATVSAWIALFIGLYALGAGIGELRSPNTWWMMLKEFERSPALRFLTGLVTLALGATIYLVNPWRPDDWLAIGVTVVSGVVVAEGLLMLAASEQFLNLGRVLIGRAGRLWAVLAALLGLAAIVAGLSRLHVF